MAGTKKWKKKSSPAQPAEAEQDAPAEELSNDEDTSTADELDEVEEPLPLPEEPAEEVVKIPAEEKQAPQPPVRERRSVRLEDQAISEADWQLFLVQFGRKQICDQNKKICTPSRGYAPCVICFNIFIKKRRK